MAYTDKELIDFLEGTQANLFSDGKHWHIATAVSECVSRNIRSCISEAIDDHEQAIREGDEDAKW